MKKIVKALMISAHAMENMFSIKKKHMLGVIFIAMITLMIVGSTNPVHAALIDNGNGTVTDDDIGIMWLRTSVDQAKTRALERFLCKSSNFQAYTTSLRGFEFFNCNSPSSQEWKESQNTAQTRLFTDRSCFHRFGFVRAQSFIPNPKSLNYACVQELLMVQRKLLAVLGPFVIGLLFVELGLFCYSFYDPAIVFSPDWFPYRAWAYLLLPFGAVALIIGTTYLVSAKGEEKE